MIKRLIAAAVACAASAISHADDFSGPYFGLLGGSSQISRDLGDGVEWNSNKFTWGALLGWQVHRNFGVEVTYLRPATDRQSGVVDGDLYEVAAKTSGFSATAVLMFPIGDNFSVHGRVGALRAREKYLAWVNDFPEGSASDTTTEVIFGGGITKTFERTMLRVEYQRAEFEYGDVGLFSLSLSWLFRSPQ